MLLSNAVALENAIKDTDLNCDIGRFNSGAYVLVSRGFETVFFEDQLDDDKLNTTTLMLSVLIGGGFFE